LNQFLNGLKKAPEINRLRRRSESDCEQFQEKCEAVFRPELRHSGCEAIPGIV
jgi:hypothetical protein